MIERVFLKDYLSFKKVELNLQEGLTAFTGASGAGKSLFMDGLLTLFGFKESEVGLIEVDFSGNLPILEKFGLNPEEPNVFKLVKQKKSRYFINSQAISKKNMQEICFGIIRYLSLKDANELSSDSLLELLDTLIVGKKAKYKDELKKYKEFFRKFLEIQKRLKEIEQEEKNIAELKEFARFEIESIDSIDPKIGEDEELMDIKKTLSKKEKLQNAIESANGIFEYESKVHEVLKLSDTENSFFDECMNELRVQMDESIQKLESLEDLDVESLLERIEQIAKLKSRYGTIEEILAYKAKKKEELARYENISFEKKHLQEEYDNLKAKATKASQAISKQRVNAIKNLEKIINNYLKRLYLSHGSLKMEKSQLYELGEDVISVHLNNVDINKISSGEMNRLRLAFIATKNELFGLKEGGVLILDEVDANVSGKEAMSVAKVLKELSLNYQVLAISHQPQLSSVANEHYLVEKRSTSTITLLSKEQRVQELARMISGEEIKDEATEFATKLLDEAKLV